MKSLNGAQQEVKSNNNEENEMNNLESAIKDVCELELSEDLESVSDDFLGVIGVDIEPTIRLVRSFQMSRGDIFNMFLKRQPSGPRGNSYPTKREFFLNKKFNDVFQKKFEKSNPDLPFCKDFEYFLGDICSIYLNKVIDRRKERMRGSLYFNERNFADFTNFCMKIYDEQGWMPKEFKVCERFIYKFNDVNNKDIKLDADFLRNKEVLKNYLLNVCEFEKDIPSILKKGIWRSDELDTLKLESLSIQLNGLPVGVDMET